MNPLQQHEMETMLRMLDGCLRESARAAAEAEAWAKRAAEYQQAIKDIASKVKR